MSKLGTVDMTIGGTFTSPKVGIDLESLAKQAAQQAAKSALSSLGEKLGVSGGSNATETADSTAAAPATNAEKAANAIGKALDLFKKKK